MKLYSPKTINEIKDLFGFKFSKSLGQNFLTDYNIIQKIAEGSNIGEEDLVVEIGPGIGVITAECCQRAKKVVAIELDRNLLPVLNYTLAEYNNVKVINGDVLKTDINEIIEKEGFKKAKIIGNLPYYITTPIIMQLLENHVNAESITVMMQKEVADRIKSAPGKKTYGAISVAVQYYCTVETVTDVSKEVFMPKPKVDSTVLRLDLREEPPVKLINRDVFFQCVKKGFGQRRKTLLNALNGIRGMDKEQIKDCLCSASIDPGRRAETLSIEEFAELSNKICEKEVEYGENS